MILLWESLYLGPSPLSQSGRVFLNPPILAGFKVFMADYQDDLTAHLTMRALRDQVAGGK